MPHLHESKIRFLEELENPDVDVNVRI